MCVYVYIYNHAVLDCPQPRVSMRTPTLPYFSVSRCLKTWCETALGEGKLYVRCLCGPQYLVTNSSLKSGDSKATPQYYPNACFVLNS